MSPLETLGEFVDEIYPGIVNQVGNNEYFKDRALLSAKNTVVDTVGYKILDKCPGENNN